jgi:predicted secreted protein
MTITGALVLFSVIWFLTFYVVLMIRTRTQEETGEVVPGTPSGAPATEDVGKSARIATLWAAGIWVPVVAVILSGWISIRDIDFFDRMAPEARQVPQD